MKDILYYRYGIDMANVLSQYCIYPSFWQDNINYLYYIMMHSMNKHARWQ